MKKQRRIIVLTEGLLGIFSSKTGTSVIRYCAESVVCVLDSKAARQSRPLESFIGVGHGIPIVSSIKEALKHAPTELLIGVAPVGGQLPDAWRKLILQALAAGLHIVSGLHQALNEDPELAAAARRTQAVIHDVRIPPDDIGVAEDKLRKLKQRRISVVGSDCSVGKMVTAIEVDKGLRARGYDSEFVATGQTGIMIAGSGIAVDHVLSDYVNGAAERLCWERRKREVLVIEGQGSVYHPAYSGVTVGLLHGSMPHVLLFTHATARTHISHYEQFKLPPIKQAIQLIEDLTKPLFPAKVAAIALNTVGTSDAAALRAARKIEDQTGLPAADPIRHGAGKLVDAAEKALRIKQDA